jgi:V-type H+-transporting ATPase subunit a
MFPGQGGLQLLILFACFVSVPIMLFPKPIILKRRHEQKNRGGAYVRLDEDDGNGMQQVNSSEELRSLGGNSSNNNNSSGDDHGHGDGEFDFGDVLVHQMIHTIEFVLGAISNTASYLRLWALSLAHAQLSAVFWDRCLMAAVESGSIVAIVIGFGVWLGATLGVLLGMESLSAFLHALRLHWVEYQNKFYKGDGVKFTPLEFTSLMGMPDEN